MPKNVSASVVGNGILLTKAVASRSCCCFLTMHSARSGNTRRIAKARQTCCMYVVNSSKGIMISLSRSKDSSPGHVNIARTPSMWSLRRSSSSLLGTSTKQLRWFWKQRNMKQTILYDRKIVLPRMNDFTKGLATVVHLILIEEVEIIRIGCASNKQLYAEHNCYCMCHFYCVRHTIERHTINTVCVSHLL